MNVREQYFSFLHSEESIIKELEEYFDVNLCEVFDKYNEQEFGEFFNLGEGNRISWNDLELIIKKFKVLVKGR